MNKIKRYTFSQIKGLGLKDLRRAIKIQRVLNLALCYHHFTMMMLHRDLVKHENPSYQEAEKTADFFNAIFNTDAKPTVFISDKNEMAEKALKDYKEYSDYLKAMEVLGFDKESVSAFCKAVEYSWIKGLGHFKYKINLDYRFYIEATIAFMAGKISYDELRYSFTETSIIKRTTTPLNKRQVLRFYRDMLSAYNLLIEISNKRKSRALRRLTSNDGRAAV